MNGMVVKLPQPTESDTLITWHALFALHHPQGRQMGQAILAVFGLVVLAALGGGLDIAMGDIPPPTETIEKTLPDARFNR